MYDPLPRILTFDNFDDGIRGWCRGIANHANDLDVIPPQMRYDGPPQISNCQFFDIGTHGAMSGNYALKVASKPYPGANSTAMKRLTSRKLGLVQFETYFTFKSEVTFEDPDNGRAWDGNISPSEDQFGSFSVHTDLWAGSDTRRWYGTLRYVNTDPDGNLVQKWMYSPTRPVFSKDRVLDDVAPRTYKDHFLQLEEIENGHQPLCYNETATKINWHYLRWRFNSAKGRHEELTVNDLTLDLRDLDVPMITEEYKALRGLLNLKVGVQTHTSVRNFLFLDSALISVDW
jgi:hypothetical protein